MKWKLLRLFCVAVAGAILGTSSPWAQVDLAKSLVGKWEGEATWAGSAGSVVADANRTLIIDAVTQKDGKWVATGRYGITGKGLGKVDIEVDEGGGSPLHPVHRTNPDGSIVACRAQGPDWNGDLYRQKHPRRQAAEAREEGLTARRRSELRPPPSRNSTWPVT